MVTKAAMRGWFPLAVLSVALVTACGRSESDREVSSAAAKSQLDKLAGPTVGQTPTNLKPTSDLSNVETATSEERSLSSPSNPPDRPTAANDEGAADAALGTFKVRFLYGGQPPRPEPIEPTSDVAFCGQHELRSQRLVVDPETRGIKNVLVHVYTGRGGSELPQTPARGASVVLANLDCRFAPHLVLTQVGDTLRVTNPDPIGHNANIAFDNNKKVNFTIPAGQEKSVELVESEPRPVAVECNIHPWMKAYVLVLDHPFAAVSDEGGELTISGLPADRKLVFRAFHEAGVIRSVVIDGQPVEWSRSRFELDMQPGVNDLGTVVVPESTFR